MFRQVLTLLLLITTALNAQTTNSNNQTCAFEDGHMYCGYLKSLGEPKPPSLSFPSYPPYPLAHDMVCNGGVCTSNSPIHNSTITSNIVDMDRLTAIRRIEELIGKKQKEIHQLEDAEVMLKDEPIAK